MLAKLGELPDTMRESGRRANQYQNAVLNLVEAAMLAPAGGGVVPGRRPGDRREGRPPRRRHGAGAGHRGDGGRARPLPVGEDVTVTLTKADIATRAVEFTLE